MKYEDYIAIRIVREASIISHYKYHKEVIASLVREAMEAQRLADMEGVLSELEKGNDRDQYMLDAIAEAVAKIEIKEEMDLDLLDVLEDITSDMKIFDGPGDNILL